MQIVNAIDLPLMGAYHVVSSGQIILFNGAELTISGCMALNVDGLHRSLLDHSLVEEATQLMIDNGIVITNEADKVGV